MTEDFSLAIGSAFYEVKAYSPYIRSLIESTKVLDELKIRWDWYERSGDSYPDRAKNSLVHRFLKSDFSHLMIIDSDEEWEVEGFARLIKAAMAGPEIVAGCYPCKNVWHFYGCHHHYKGDNFSGIEVDGMRLLDMECVPGGFIIYSRKAFERTRPNLATYFELGEHVLECFRCSVEKAGDIEDTKAKVQQEIARYNDYDREALLNEVLEMRRRPWLINSGGIRYGEDVFFQRRYQEMGGVIWLEPNITIKHWGVQAWAGNYHQHLCETRDRAEAERAESER